MKKFLLLTVALIWAMMAYADVVSDGDTYEAKNGITCQSLWMYDPDLSDWADFDAGNDSNSRTAVIDADNGYVYVSSTNGFIFVYDMWTGELVKTLPLSADGSTDALWACSICLDDYGHVLIGSSQTGGSNLIVYLVDMETGACTNTLLPMTADDNGARTDLFDVKGDFTGVQDGCMVAAVPCAVKTGYSGSPFLIYCWTREQGQDWQIGFGDGDWVSVEVDSTYPASASGGWSTTSLAKILKDGDDTYFLVDGNTTYPAIYDYDGGMVTSFADATSLTPADAGTNGACMFTLAGKQFFAYSMGQYNNGSQINVCELPDGELSFSGMEKYWALPDPGIGSAASNGGWRIHAISAGSVTDPNGKEGILLLSYEGKICCGVYLIAEDGFDMNASAEETPVVTAPTVTTGAAADITSSSATLSATIEAGSEEISDQGFKYATSEEALEEAEAVSAELGADGSMTLEVSGLEAETEYFFVAYAVTESGTTTGDVASFTTEAAAVEVTAPTVTTGEAADITSSSATLSATIEAGSEEITDQGFKYAISEEALEEAEAVSAELGEDGSMTLEVSGLEAETEYFFVAYAVTASGTTTGDVASFTTEAEEAAVEPEEPEPEPVVELVAKNAYAYNISVETGDDAATVSYQLNAIANAVTVQAWADDELVAEYQGTADAGVNSVDVPFSDLPSNTEISIKVKVSSDIVSGTVSAADIAGNDNNYYKFYCPYGIAIDNDPESANFGRILVTETQTNCYGKSGYLSSIPDQGGNGIGVGIYAFDPLMQPIANSEGGYGFTGGIEREEAGAVYPKVTGTTVYDFKRIHYTDDGRLFMSRVSTHASGLWELDPNDLESGATPVFEGNLDENTGLMTDAEGNFVAGPATAMDVYGSGDDLKIAIVSCQDGYELSAPSHRVDVYNLGSASTWSEAPTIANLGSSYWVNSAIINALFDADGEGLTIGQYRGSPSDAEPAYVNFDLTTLAETYKDIATVAGGAGMAWNADKSMLALATAAAQVTVYTVADDGEGNLSFTKLCDVTTGLGTNSNAVAFDIANNLYVCSNSGEKFSTFALPRESEDVTVAAASSYNFTTPEAVELVEKNAYAYDISVAVDDENATVKYRLNAVATAVEVEACDGDDVVYTVEGTMDAGLNSVKVPISELPANTEISIKIKVTSDVATAASVAAIAGNDNTYYKFYCPYGIAVDNNPESDNFGRILVTETQTNCYAKSGYLSSIPDNGGNGIGVGIYAFDPLMQPIANSEGGYGFTGGIEREEAGAVYPKVTGTTVYDFKRIHYTDDGRLFLSRTSTHASGLWELDPNDLESGATPVFEGNLDENTGLITDAEGNFVAGPATAMDVYGSGDDLKIAIVSCQDGYELSAPSHRVDVYNLGSASTWSEAPTIANIGSSYWVNSPSVNALFDAEGEGLTVGQYRAAPSDAEPAYVNFDLTTLAETYKDITTVANGGGMAWNADKSMLAMATANAQVTVYTVADDGEGNLSFTKLCDVTTGLGNASNAIAFDVANNLYICSNSGEKFSTFVLPRESGDVAVPAASYYNFVTPAEEPTEFLFSFVASEDAATGISIEGESEGIVVAVDYGDGNDPVTFTSESNIVTIDPASAGNTVTVYGVDPATIISIDASGLGISDIELSDDLENLFFLTISDNALTFSTLPIVDTDQVVYTYAPQADIEVSVEDGGEYNSPCVIDLSSEADINGTATVYAWYTSDGEALVEGEDYTIDGGVTTFTGVATDVYCLLTNELFPDLTLKTTTVEVDKVESIAADGSAVVSVIPGAILISGEFDNAVIYNTAGIAVVAKASSENKVQSGIYIVVVDGNVTKVAVK